MTVTKKIIFIKSILLIMIIFLVMCAFPQQYAFQPNESNIAQNNATDQSIITNYKVIIDGKRADVEAYNINDNNYYKLRDIAFLLNKTSKQIEIKYDAIDNSVNILTDKPYTPVGGELLISAKTSNMTATPSVSKIYVDGTTTAISAYNINGNNYFKLRDLGKIIDFEISWDSSLHMIFIESDDSYDESLPDTGFGKTAYSYVSYIQNNLSKRIAGTQVEKDTADYIISELKKLGYDLNQITVQNFEFTKDGKIFNSQNIIVQKQGKKDGIIIIGAHYDSVGTHGVDDNGSGVSAVLEAATRLIAEPTPYTVQFMFFGAEERGYLGAKHYISTLSKEEQTNILLMINIDSILAGDKQYLFGGINQDDGSLKDDWAANQAKKIADDLSFEMHLNPYVGPNYYSPNNMSDHKPFRNINIPYVFFWAGNLDVQSGSSINQTIKFGQIMHKPEDDLSILNKYFQDRAQERLTNYSLLLYQMIKHINPN